MLKVYYNPKCSKCRTAKQFLDEHQQEYELFEYLDESFTENDIKEILQMGKLQVTDILRTNEEEYKQHVKGKNLSEEQIIKLIVRYPKMLQRPIIISKKKATVARDEDSLQKAIN